ncbi:N-acetylglucosamine-6-phosphate deacetylase [Falsochrobactrum shanghaiense]|uniref:N-acetylglucosamine-6-phosphate deacetylase n=1 Tax=Falsochrobactrum shanghaiense TaxID=2201899 RepID=A0A316J8J4_9HYPH|nr:amidohydrolase family protein [Falsochrobactrum shanghaiense]PWL17606.1 N-acetylglucosamine-6-phosphate deacetylase [Falsochrobactrum shanghaiense]
MITPGLIDIQVNGFAGVDFNSGDLTADKLDHALEAMLATGVTTCLPTIITASLKELERRFLALDKSVRDSRLGRLMCPGYHLEGPFLNPADGYSGCHPASAMTGADVSLFDHLQGLLVKPILLTTLAPEVDGGIDFTRQMRARDVLVAIGHSACDFDLAAQAAEAGATISTHLGNGLPQILPKLNNSIFAQLAEDRLTASFIADGIHIPPQALKVLLRAKGTQRSILVTDAVSAAAVPSGNYQFANLDIERLDDGTVWNPNGAGLAGSSLRLDDAIRNLVNWEIASFDEAVSMASHRVAEALASALSVRGIRLPMSQIEWSDALTVKRVSIAGEEYYAS